MNYAIEIKESGFEWERRGTTASYYRAKKMALADARAISGQIRVRNLITNAVVISFEGNQK